jgi:hypothetical protein
VSPFAAHQPVTEPGHRDRTDSQQSSDGLAALLPHQDAQHNAAHAKY